MHEYPAAERIVRLACEKSGNGRVKSVSLVMGDDCGYLPESVALLFELLSEGTACEGAVLSIERVKPLLRCQSCGGMFARRPFSFECPDCGGEGRPTDIGREFIIQSIEVEEN